jgi:hypothetical protein
VSKWTPGPWQIQPISPIRVHPEIFAGKVRLADVLSYGVGTQAATANARLIAAAPELLAACKSALARIESDISDDCAEAHGLRAALRAAEGE